jgi:hypothetical protein
MRSVTIYQKRQETLNEFFTGGVGEFLILSIISGITYLVINLINS